MLLLLQTLVADIEDLTGVLILLQIYRILHECSCFIEFIKRVEEKRSNVRLAEHFISFLQQVK